MSRLIASVGGAKPPGLSPKQVKLVTGKVHDRLWNWIDAYNRSIEAEYVANPLMVPPERVEATHRKNADKEEEPIQDIKKELLDALVPELEAELIERINDTGGKSAPEFAKRSLAKSAVKRVIEDVTDRHIVVQANKHFSNLTGEGEGMDDDDDDKALKALETNAGRNFQGKDGRIKAGPQNEIGALGQRTSDGDGSEGDGSLAREAASPPRSRDGAVGSGRTGASGSKQRRPSKSGLRGGRRGGAGSGRAGRSNSRERKDTGEGKMPGRLQQHARTSSKGSKGGDSDGPAGAAPRMRGDSNAGARGRRPTRGRGGKRT